MTASPEVDATVPIVALIVYLCGPLLVPIVIGLFKPGRRGRIAATADVQHDGLTIEEAMEVYARRLEDDGFDVVRGHETVAGTRGKGGKGFSHPAFEVFTHARKPLEADIRFTALQDGVLARVRIRMTDFVVCDTGEGRFVDLLLARLVSEDPSSVPPPVVSNLSPKAGFAFYSVIFMAIGAAVLPFLGFDDAVIMLIVLLVATMVTGAMSLLGLYDVYMKPKEMSGRRESLVALVGCILVLLLSVAIFGVRHGGQLRQKWEEARSAREEAASIKTDAPTGKP